MPNRLGDATEAYVRNFAPSIRILKKLRVILVEARSLVPYK